MLAVAPAFALTPVPTAAVTVALPAFRHPDIASIDVPVGDRAFDSDKAGTAGTVPAGVVMRVIGGVPYDFALRQANSGYASLNSYRLTGNRYFLDSAVTQADRLISMHRTQGDGWFFPSTFRYTFNYPCREILTPPWYSGYSQGVAAGLFARLYEATGKDVYLDAARHTIASFYVPRAPGRPWVSAVDGNGYLRLEEYPDKKWEFVFNGHIIAALGINDCYRVTGDPRALDLYQGALASVLRYGSRFRNVGWISAYSLGVRQPYAGYHVIVTNLLLKLYTASGDTRFARLANDYDADYPAPASGVLRVVPGTYRAYRFAASGARLASRVMRVRTAVTLPADARSRVRGRSGSWIRVARGPFKGYFLLEAPSRVYIRGVVDSLTYRPELGATLKAGRVRGEQFGTTGSVTASMSVDVAAAEPVTLGQKAVVNGSPKVLVASGALAGHWVPASAVILP
jgi:hypothetical protein